MIKVLVADDEPLARRRLERLLSVHADVHIAAVATNGTETVDLIRAVRPHVLFLDVQMPDLDGFGVIAEVGPEEMPVTVFVTAFDRYALAAFDAQAIDYLLKPFADERFEQAFARARAHLKHKGSMVAAFETILEKAVKGNPLSRFPVRANDHIYFVLLEDIHWFSSEGPYVRLHTGDGKTHLVRDSIKNLVDRLDPSRYLRIHRSTLVDSTRIKALYPRGHSDYDVEMSNGHTLKLSRRYRELVISRLGL